MPAAQVLDSHALLTLLRDERQQVDWLASGKYPIALTAKADEVKATATALGKSIGAAGGVGHDHDGDGTPDH